MAGSKDPAVFVLGDLPSCIAAAAQLLLMPVYCRRSRMPASGELAVALPSNRYRYFG
jgi:hypothetical protein